MSAKVATVDEAESDATMILTGNGNLRATKFSSEELTTFKKKWSDFVGEPLDEKDIKVALCGQQSEVEVVEIEQQGKCLASFFLQQKVHRGVLAATLEIEDTTKHDDKTLDRLQYKLLESLTALRHLFKEGKSIKMTWRQRWFVGRQSSGNKKEVGAGIFTLIYLTKQDVEGQYRKTESTDDETKEDEPETKEDEEPVSEKSLVVTNSPPVAENLPSFSECVDIMFDHEKLKKKMHAKTSSKTSKISEKKMTERVMNLKQFCNNPLAWCDAWVNEDFGKAKKAMEKTVGKEIGMEVTKEVRFLKMQRFVTNCAMLGCFTHTTKALSLIQNMTVAAFTLLEEEKDENKQWHEGGFHCLTALSTYLYIYGHVGHAVPKAKKNKRDRNEWRLSNIVTTKPEDFRLGCEVAVILHMIGNIGSNWSSAKGVEHKVGNDFTKMLKVNIAEKVPKLESRIKTTGVVCLSYSKAKGTTKLPVKGRNTNKPRDAGGKRSSNLPGPMPLFMARAHAALMSRPVKIDQPAIVKPCKANYHRDSQTMDIFPEGEEHKWPYVFTSIIDLERLIDGTPQLTTSWARLDGQAKNQVCILPLVRSYNIGEDGSLKFEDKNYNLWIGKHDISYQPTPMSGKKFYDWKDHMGAIKEGKVSEVTVADESLLMASNPAKDNERAKYPWLGRVDQMNKRKADGKHSSIGKKKKEDTVIDDETKKIADLVGNMDFDWEVPDSDSD